MSKKISIIIVTYNSELLIFDCLDSIIKYNDIGKNLEIIVVDNNSQNVDLMFTSIREKFGDEIILIKNDKNGGYGQGNNVGVKKANSPLIMIMNPDVRLLHPIFNKIMTKFEASKFVMLGMLQMITKTKKGISFSVKLICSSVFSVFETILCNKLNYYNSNRMYISGSCFVIDKAVFEKVGLFDENIFMYGEENDLHHRLIKLNYNDKIIFDKSIAYLHLSENRPLLIKTWVQMLNSSLYFCKKNEYDALKVINDTINIAVLFKIIALIKFNIKHFKIYNEWLEILSEYKKKYKQ